MFYNRFFQMLTVATISGHDSITLSQPQNQTIVILEQNSCSLTFYCTLFNIFLFMVYCYRFYCLLYYISRMYWVMFWPTV